mgnify:CR=1 FL=1
MSMPASAVSSRGIGWQGRTLKSMLEESERLFAATGRYCGVEALELKTSDPIGYEKLSSRLRGALVGARETARSISGNPVVRETGELCFALYTPEGDSITLSTGIMAHVHTMSEAIKYMIRNDYEGTIGIDDGDIFINNDPIAGDIHPLDVQNFVPIFHEGELLGWVGGVTHVLDCGISSPDVSYMTNVSRLEDGWILTCQKNGTKDRLSQDYLLRSQTATRMPFYWKLDEKARIAGCHIVRSAVLRVVGEVGVDYYKRFMREVLEDTRRIFLKNTRLLTIPGVYRQAAFADYPHSVNTGRLPKVAAVDTLVHAPMKTVITTSGSIEVDLDGASSWGYHTFNCTPTALQAGLWVCLTEMLIHNEKINDGAYYATKLSLPYGSWANPDNPLVSTLLSWTSFLAAFTGMARALAQSFASRGFLEEVIAGYPYASNVTIGGGPSHHGDADSGYNNFEFSASGISAGYVRDGTDTGGAIWNPEGDMGDVEAWEQIEPLLYLGRRIWPNSAGMGKYRGGSGFESIRMVSGVSHQYMSNLGTGKTFFGGGMFGGYPAPTLHYHCISETDLPERFAKRLPYPVENRDPENSIMKRDAAGTEHRGVEMLHAAITLREHDLYLSPVIGGNGLGDPLERDPSAVAEDLNGGHLLERFAEPVFGVICRQTDGRWIVDEEATRSRRAAIRRERLARSVPVSEWIAGEKARVEARDLIEPVRKMYGESIRLSKDWGKEFRSFWSLPPTWMP